MKKGELGPGLVVAIVIGIIVLVVVALYFSKSVGEGASRIGTQSQSKKEAAESGCKLACQMSKTATGCRSWVGMYCGKMYDQRTCDEVSKTIPALKCENRFGTGCTCEKGAVCNVACASAGATTSCDGWRSKYCNEWYDADMKCYEAADKGKVPVCKGQFNDCSCEK